MKVENHILEILQLYEYSMAIGKSLDYNENCNSFLKLVLKRKHLNAGWILERENNLLTSKYAIPKGNKISVNNDNEIDAFLDEIISSRIIALDERFVKICPVEITKGQLTVFSLDKQVFLFLYSQKDTMTPKDVSQIQPVVNKFATSLKACKTFEKQKVLLKNLERQNQELKDYTHMVSHDLKSPLQSIEALTSWLGEDYKDVIGKDGNDKIKLIKGNVEKMDTLVKGVLEYATIDKLEKRVHDVNTHYLLEKLVSTNKIPENIIINIANKLPIIKADTYRLEQLFRNLISNAIKFNDKEKGVVEIGSSEKENYWEFYVRDNGRGIGKNHFEKIFTAFQKLENNYKSSGIGLSIVKKIIDLYGGKIWLESELNVGTTFYFTLKK